MKRLDLSLLPADIRALVESVGVHAQKAGVRAYLVGGVVRDLVLGLPGTDVDVVIEGDGILFASDLGKRLKARVVVHEKFRTASLFLKGGPVLDIVTARRETYARPGALPDVVPATIGEDLLRRDFTVNAIAVGINRGDAGAVKDDVRGLKDIDLKLIRVMHESSFTDDPTRILRAARYAVRFGFHLEALTEDVLAQAVAADVFRTITAPRYFLEFCRILEEKDPAPVLDLLAAWGAVRYVPYGIDERAALLTAGPAWDDRLAALMKGLSPEKAREILVAFNVSRSSQKKIMGKKG